MKKLVVLIFSLVCIVVLIIVSFLNINKKNYIIVNSKFSNYSLNLGKYNVKKVESRYENNNNTVYICFDMDNFKESICNNKYFIKKIDDEKYDKYLFNSDGFYYVGYIDSEYIIFFELLNSYYDFYFPLFTDKRMIMGTSISDIYFKNSYTYEELVNEYSEYFEIKDKNSLLEYINSLNNDFVYYNSDLDQIFIKRNSDSNDEFNVHIKFIDEGITIYGKR